MNARLRSLRLTPLWLAACLLATAISTDSNAQSPSGRDRAHIGAAGRGIDGRVAINQSAGTGNTQANLAAIAIAPDGLALIEQHARQRSAIGAQDRRREASARIDAQAFAGHDGLLSLNQSAGAGNAQLNSFVLAQDAQTGIAHIAGVDDNALADVAGAPSIETQSAPSLRDAAIADDAFRGGRGVLQLNQTAGTGNASVNAIVLQLPGGVP